MKRMWPFRKQSTIIVYCDFPRFKDKDDKEFLYRALMEDLISAYGNCYKIELYTDAPDKVVFKDFKEEKTKERAIRIDIHRRINKCK